MIVPLLGVVVVMLLPAVAGARDDGGSASDSAMQRQVEQSSILVQRANGTSVEIPCTLTNALISCMDGASGLIGVISSKGDHDLIQPESATGTNKDVLITVVGSGLWVDDWTTRARQYPFDGCTDHDAYFYAKEPPRTSYDLVGFILYNGPCVTVPSYAHSIDWWTYGDVANGPYVDGTRLCNGWEPNQKLSGFPCITVHD
jgi:hypothetical protein